MKINFTSEQKNEEPTFGDVEAGQFFINANERLCQKVNDARYHVIAGRDGIPLPLYSDTASISDPITRILPKVTKINF